MILLKMTLWRGLIATVFVALTAVIASPFL